jgi:hypothetical protein
VVKYDPIFLTWWRTVFLPNEQTTWIFCPQIRNKLVCLIIHCFTSRLRMFHLYGHDTIPDAKFRHLVGAQGLWAGRDLYRSTPAVKWDLHFPGLILRTVWFSCLFPDGILCWMNVESTLNEHLNQNLILIWRCFNVVCLLCYDNKEAGTVSIVTWPRKIN